MWADKEKGQEQTPGLFLCKPRTMKIKTVADGPVGTIKPVPTASPHQPPPPMTAKAKAKAAARRVRASAPLPPHGGAGGVVWEATPVLSRASERARWQSERARSAREAVQPGQAAYKAFEVEFCHSASRFAGHQAG